MAYQNTKSTYGSVAKFFHWSAFLLILLMLCVGPFMEDITDKALRGQVFTIHKLTGLSILLLMLLRLGWSLANPKPELPPGSNSAWHLFASRSMHLLLYLSAILMPLSGWIMSTAAGKAPSFFGAWPMPLPGIPESEALKEFAHGAHTFFAWTLFVLISVHFLAALHHHFIKKNDILRRMMIGRNKGV